MKDNTLVAVFLVVGLLTPVFGWLFYCWFKSHVSDQHQEGQIFHRRERDRTQANYRQGNSNSDAFVGPYFTQRGWIRQKPYGETHVLPLSQRRMPAHSRPNYSPPTPSRRASPPPQNQQPNPFSKRQQRKQRAAKLREQKQQQDQDHQSDNQNRQNRKKQKKKNSKKNKSNANNSQNRSQSRHRSDRRSNQDQVHETKNDGWGGETSQAARNDDQASEAWGNLGGLFGDADNEKQNDDKHSTHSHDNKNDGGWGQKDDNAGDWGQSGWDTKAERSPRSSRHQSHHSKRRDSHHGSPRRGSRNRNRNRSRNRSSSPRRESAWDNNNEHQSQNNDGWQDGNNQQDGQGDWNGDRHASPDRRSRASRSPKGWDQGNDQGGWGGNDDRHQNDWDNGDRHEEKRSWSQEGNVHKKSGRNHGRSSRSRRGSPRGEQQDWNHRTSPEPQGWDSPKPAKAMEW